MKKLDLFSDLLEINGDFDFENRSASFGKEIILTDNTLSVRKNLFTINEIKSIWYNKKGNTFTVDLKDKTIMYKDIQLSLNL